MSYRPFNVKSMRVVPFVIALMAIAVLLLLGDSVQAQQAATTVQYNEEDTVPVITLTATDPEGASPILWSLLASTDEDDQDIPGEGDNDGQENADDVETEEGQDGDLFKISANGVLEFKNKPDFENPADDGGGNEYKVVVQASDGGTMNWFKLTVNVMDVEEEGSVKLSPGIAGEQPVLQAGATLLQPQVGVGITAHSLTDPDGVSEDARTDATYQWYRTSSRTAMGTEIEDEDEEAATYTPRATAGDTDVGSYLRVVATYRDGRGRNKTATAVSDYVTIGRISDNTPPVFPRETTTRATLEGMPKGTAIGNPVTATDRDSGEMLTYWLSEHVDDAMFDINPRTGQLKVENELDLEGTMAGTDRCATANQCSVMVSVADSSGTAAGTATIIVAITVTNVDEKPTTFTGATTIEHVEGTTELMSSGDNPAPVTYTAADPGGRRGHVYLVRRRR